MIAVMPSIHAPVMLREVVHGLQLRPGLTIVDGTVGGGGHSREILPHIQPGGRLLGIDRDPMMLGYAADALSDSAVVLRQGSYADLPEVLSDLDWSSADRILVDLGLSSDQLADRTRGFSFQSAGELDLRFDPSDGRSAAELIEDLSAEELEGIFREFGEEPHSQKIAEEIVHRRATRPIRTGLDLTQAVLDALKKRHAGRDAHPATRVFQALRIAVNDELGHVERALIDSLPGCLAPGGILAVITFHSLEDRIVKQAFKDSTKWELLSLKPITPTPAEIRFNPRSRSAKLRLARRK